METPEQNPTEESQDTPDESTGALNDDNPETSEDAGQQGAGSEPDGEDAPDTERP